MLEPSAVEVTPMEHRSMLRRMLVPALLLQGFCTLAEGQFDDKVAAQGLAEAVKQATATYKAEASESLVILSAQWAQVFENASPSGLSPDDVLAIAQVLDAFVMGVRDDLAASVQVLGQGASGALAVASGGGPIDGDLPPAFRVGAGKTVDKAIAKLEKLQHKVFGFVGKAGKKVSKMLAKQADVTLLVALAEPSDSPVLAFDESGALAPWDVELSLDLFVCASGLVVPATHRVVVAGFAADAQSDVVVERLDLLGQVVEATTATPNLGRWMAVFDLDASGPVVLRARQGAVGVTRSLWSP